MASRLLRYSITFKTINIYISRLWMQPEAEGCHIQRLRRDILAFLNNGICGRHSRPILSVLFWLLGSQTMLNESVPVVVPY